MGSIVSSLMAGERIVMTARLHKIIFLEVAILVMVSLIYFGLPLSAWALYPWGFVFSVLTLITLADSLGLMITYLCLCIISFSLRVTLANSEFDWVLSLLGIALLLVALCDTSKGLIAYFTSEFVVTNKRVLVKTGLIRRHSLELLLSKVEGILVNQGAIDRLIGCGTIIITGTGGSQNPYRHIAAPFEFRRRVQEQIAKAQDK